jgi:glycosyltransferase involved in cell wall biosynthesis
MAMEAPVLATRVGGVASLISDGHSGLLIEPGSTEELDRGLTDLVGNSALRQRIAESARETVVSTFSFEVRMRKVAAIYDRLTTSRSPEHPGT